MEIGPDDVLPALERGFAGGWHFRYPPFHFYLLSLTYLPFLGAAHHGLIDLHAETAGAVLSLAGRVLTIAMAVSSTALVYLCGRLIATVRTGVLAALVWSLVLPLAYYGKMVNLDVPYTFWFVLSLVGYLRALMGGTTRDFIRFGAAGAAAICTKDQAYGLCLFPALYLVFARRQAWRALVASAGAALIVFVAGHNLLFNRLGFTRHVEDITGGYSDAFRMIDSSSPSGQLWLFGRALEHIAWSMSWPGALAAAAGVVIAFRDSPPVRRLLLAVPLAPASYYVTFIAVLEYHSDRFFLPVCLALAIVAGRALDRLWPETSRGWKTAAVGAALVYMTLRTASINMLMAADGRYTVERWMRENLPPGTVIGAVEFPSMLPRLSAYQAIFLFGPDDKVKDRRPNAFVISDNYPRRFPAGAPELQWYEDLVAGRLGYRVAYRHKARVTLAIVALERPFRDFDGSFTTLHKVNPEIVVLVRQK